MRSNEETLSRSSRARELVRKGYVTLPRGFKSAEAMKRSIWTGEAQAIVRSENHDQDYVVRGGRCTCEDFLHRGPGRGDGRYTCKHILAVQYQIIQWEFDRCIDWDELVPTKPRKLLSGWDGPEGEDANGTAGPDLANEDALPTLKLWGQPKIYQVWS